MLQIPAIGVTSFEGEDISSDGQLGLFRFLSGETEVVLAIPHEQLISLMAGISNVSGKGRRVRTQNPTGRHVFPCERWAFGLTPDQRHLVLSFRVPGGAELSFQVSRTTIPAMRETLQTMEEGASNSCLLAQTRQ
jgi:hypothetical protein